ncbi:MAG: BspA family leucine-rich repeat surface protein [Bacilli bacterium]|nr:BspA family leucine-rich repeat surface protein [Bacilli bacterium]
MKKIIKLFLVMIMFTAMPVLAEEQPTITKEPETIVTEGTIKEPIIIKSVKAETEDKKVQLRETEGLDIVFNELNQTATYTVKLENTSNEVLYVNDLEVENLSEEFISFSLSPKSVNAKIEPGQSKEIEVIVKTLDISQAGRNVNDDVTLKFILSREVVKNPETSSNWIVYLILITTLLITFSTMFSKVNKKKRLSLIMIGLLCGTIVVSADNAITVSLTGKVTYTSQNTMQTSGVGVSVSISGYQAYYTNSKDVWKYASQIKNVIISDQKTKPEEYEFRYDLSSNDSKRIYGYLVENNDKQVPYDLYIVANGIMYAPENATGLFAFPNVETINGLEFIEFENTKTMTAMFIGDKKLKSVNVKSINTSNATTTSYMFYGCDNLNVSEKDFNLSKVTNKNYMFNTNLSDIVKVNAKSDKDIDFSVKPTSGKFMMEDTKNDKYPIYYYRGSTSYNNVLFANKCWKIVRTTETGGTKLIYNGNPTSGRYCYASGTNSEIGTEQFNRYYYSPANVGYMYGKVYESIKLDASEQQGTFVYANDVEWDGAKYTLKNTKDSSNWAEDRIELDKGYHYTCLNNQKECENVYYVNYFGDETAMYYLTFTNGTKIENVIEESFKNTRNSTIKTLIDNWYKSYMTSYTSKLEDTVWCNDRTITKGAILGKDSSSLDGTYFAGNDRMEVSFKPTVKCSSKNDSFTVDSKNGNGALTYPVGLLTADEFTLAGNGRLGYINYTYLDNGTDQWTLTPSKMQKRNVINYNRRSSRVSGNGVQTEKGVRPVISIKQGNYVIKGSGTTSDPYVIE